MAKFSKPEDIKVGVVGYGGAFNMGRKHLQQMQAAGMTPVAVTELDPERLKVAETDFPGIGTYSSLDDMLENAEINLITIITPHNTHAALGLQCLRTGRNVVCEKPMAITTAECDEMISEASSRDLLVSTYHNRHWDGCILKALEVVNSGAIGEVVRYEAGMCGYGKPRDWWRSSKSISGGIMYDWGVHLLEYALQLITTPIKEVSGFAHTGFWGPQSKWGDDINEDEAAAVVRFESQQQIVLRFSSIDMKSHSHGLFSVTGTRGKLIMGMNDFELTTQNELGETVTVKGTNPESQGQKFYDNIAAHLTTGEPLVITGEYSRRPIHVLDLAVRSAAENRTLPAEHA